MPSVYFDHCATTALDPRVAEAMADARERLAGNPSSVHGPGRRARAVLTEARSRVARALGAAPADLIFTASGSEANNLAIKGAALRAYPSAFRLVVSAIEHDCVRNAARYLADRFEHVTVAEVMPDGDGVVHAEAVDRACREGGASMVCVMAVNNETGVMQPVEEIAEVARAHGALFHCDAVQALGRMEVELSAWDCDFLAVSAHKLYGPRGVGALYARRGAAFDPLVHGGHQEGGRRAGTENVEGIVGFARAAELAIEELAGSRERMRALEGVFLRELQARGMEFAMNGAEAQRVPGVFNLAFPGVESHDLVVGMDLAGYAISAGAACSSGVIEPSHVLKAMALEAWRVEGGVRISFGKANTEREALAGAGALAELVTRLRLEGAAAATAEGPRA
jgi:cysteine desulfurase